MSDDAAAMRAADAARPPLADGCDQPPFAAIAALTEDEWPTAIAIGAPWRRRDGVAPGRAKRVDRTAALFPHDVLLALAARRPSVDGLTELVERAAN